EEAGIHSGDSACSLPPYSVGPATIGRLKAQATALARALGVQGLMNAQLAVKDGEIFVIEVNPRASRTVPFVAKTIGAPLARIAARVMAGEKLAAFGLEERPLGHVAVKEAVFPFARFPGTDLLLGPEMKSTGEVMGIDRDFGTAFAKSQLAAGQVLPTAGTVFLSVRDADKPGLVPLARGLRGLGFGLVATGGTARALDAAGIPVTTVLKVHEGRPHIVDGLKNGEIALIVNTTGGRQAIRDSFSLRHAALHGRVPYYTTMAGARAVVEALRRVGQGPLNVAPLQAYFGPLH
ncbi:MAG: carbamoyl phosphate synthase large subunit, partial [Geminicoccaceae bacterium]|nr:carbamoyl phosphate synthase large subunit [Geminicoccaceae bacterium]